MNRPILCNIEHDSNRQILLSLKTKYFVKENLMDLKETKKKTVSSDLCEGVGA
jgi:hypothetical protein